MRLHHALGVALDLDDAMHRLRAADLQLCAFNDLAFKTLVNAKLALKGFWDGGKVTAQNSRFNQVLPDLRAVAELDDHGLPTKDGDANKAKKSSKKINAASLMV